MKQTLLDQLFYNQDKWRECEKKIAKINSVGNILWVCNLIIMLNSSFVSPKHVLVNCMDELVKSKIVEVHDEKV